MRQQLERRVIVRERRGGKRRGYHEQFVGRILFIQTVHIAPVVIFALEGSEYPLFLDAAVFTEHDELVYPIIFAVFHVCGKSEARREICALVVRLFGIARSNRRLAPDDDVGKSRVDQVYRRALRLSEAPDDLGGEIKAVAARAVITAQEGARRHARIGRAKTAVRLFAVVKIDMLDRVGECRFCHFRLFALFELIFIDERIKQRIDVVHLNAVHAVSGDEPAYARLLTVFILLGEHGSYRLGKRFANRVVTQIFDYVSARAEAGEKLAEAVEQRLCLTVLCVVENDVRMHIARLGGGYLYVGGQIYRGRYELSDDVMEQTVLVKEIGACVF